MVHGLEDGGCGAGRALAEAWRGEFVGEREGEEGDAVGGVGGPIQTRRADAGLQCAEGGGGIVGVERGGYNGGSNLGCGRGDKEGGWGVGLLVEVGGGGDVVGVTEGEGRDGRGKSGGGEGEC